MGPKARPVRQPRLTWMQKEAVETEWRERGHRRDARALHIFFASLEEEGQAAASGDLGAYSRSAAIRSAPSSRGRLSAETPSPNFPRVSGAPAVGSRSRLASAAAASLALGDGVVDVTSLDLPRVTTSRGVTPAPPATRSTSLSSIWRRAASTPSLGAEGAHKLAYMWATARSELSKDDLARLVGDVHRRLLEERDRRRSAEARLADTATRHSAGTVAAA
mmetsp:Transcript_58113/g.168686  ORF Transcript_58113/g.168686 Transcript_58113/m.168686 type:complete len:220 (-) Transcript_58113:64-723(-)